jgi:Tol biopolymer transport system component
MKLSKIVSRCFSKRKVLLAVLCSGVAIITAAWIRTSSAHSTASSPDPSPSIALAVANGNIAFEAFSSAAGVTQIYTIDPNTPDALPILCGAGETREGHRPAYSPNGLQIAFTRDGQIWLMDAACTNQHSTNVTGDSPTWSPDGAKIAFVRGGVSGDIWTMNFDGSGTPTKVTDAASQAKPSGSFGNGDPAWGPNDKIVFKGFTAKTVAGVFKTVGEIFTVEKDQSGNFTVFTKRTNEPATAYAPDWSPDGTKIVFVSDRATGKGEVFTMTPDGVNADGTNLTRITNNASISNGHPAWSPDGLEIVHDDAFSNITRSPASGVNSVNGTFLTNGESPDWSPVVATPSPSPTPSITLVFSGKLRDRVGIGDAAVSSDGLTDGTFTIALGEGNIARRITKLELKVTGSTGSGWDTIPTNSSYSLGLSQGLDNTLFNSPDGSINYSIGLVTELKLFASDTNPTVFTAGRNFTLTITFSDNATATASATVGQIPTTDLGLYMSAENEAGRLNGSVPVGQSFRYHPVVTNYGPLPASGIVIEIKLPQGIVFDGNDSAHPTDCGQLSSSSPVICRITSSLAAGVDYGLIFFVRTTQAASFETTASAYGDQSEPSPDAHSNTFAVNTTTNVATDLALSVTGDSDPVQVDAPLIYTATVKNKGPLNAPNVKLDFLTDETAAYVKYQNTTQTCAEAARHVICSVGSMSAGAELTVTFQVRPTAVKSDFKLIGEATSGIFDFDKNNSKDISLTTTVVPNTAPANNDFPADLRVLGNYLLPGAPGTQSGSTATRGALKQTNVGASRQVPIFYDKNGEVYHADVAAGKSVWFVWLPPDTPGTVEFTTGPTNFDGSRSTFNTLLEVYDAPIIDNAGSIVSIAANNNVMENDLTSLVRFNYKPGHAYIIAVDGYKGATGFVALHWNVTMQSTPALASQILTKITPFIGCTRDSNQSSDICKASYDAATGYHVLNVYGTGFTTNSLVYINNAPLAGFDLTGHAINGITTFVSDKELRASIPPSPTFDSVKISDVSVYTFGSSSAATLKVMEDLLHPEAATSSFGLRAAGNGALSSVTLKQATIPVNQTKTVCGQLNFLGGEETCIDFTNDGTDGGDITVDPAYFQVYAYCATLHPGKDRASFEERLRCSANNGYGAEKLAQQLGSPFAINPKEARDTGLFKVRLHPNASAGTSVIQGYIGMQLLTQAGQLITNDGGSLTSPKPAGIVSQGGGNLISNDGAGIVASGAGNFIDQHPAAIVASGAGNVISNDGAGLITNDGASLNAAGGGQLPATGIITGATGLSLRLLSTNALATGGGSGGWFVVRSSGSTNPVYASSVNEDGSTDGKLDVTFDNTSNPRVQNLRGLAFAVALNPAVVQFAAPIITVDKAAEHATLNLTRIGDTSAPVSVQYATGDGTANDRSDYSPVFGTLFFAENETTRQIVIPLINNGYATSQSGAQRTINLVIGNAVGGAIMMPNMATINITNNIGTPSQVNPVDDARFFVRQQYLDFLGREPTQAELDSGSSPIAQCSTDQSCIRTRRLDLSTSLFADQEFSAKGFFIFRIYKAAFGLAPAYAQYLPDRINLGPGTDTDKQLFSRAVVATPEFIVKYPVTLDGPAFVDRLLANVQQSSSLNLSSRRLELISDYNLAPTPDDGRANVLLKLINYSEYTQAEFQNGLVSSAYFGYLRRDPTLEEYSTTLNMLNGMPSGAATYRLLACSLISSAEYQQRFGSAVSHTSAECAVTPTWDGVLLTTTQAEIKTWTTGGQTYAYLKLLFPNAGYRVTNWGQPSRSGNNFTGDATVEKFSGRSVQAVTTTAGIYELGALSPGSYNFTFKNGGTFVKTLAFTVVGPPSPVNPIDTAREFVRQQYRDFLNREADQSGEDFWTDNITKCLDPARRPAEQTAEQCTLRQRETTTAAFFLSPEFQYTRYFVYRMYRGGLGRQPKLSEFNPDAQAVGNGIVISGQLAGAKIEQNKAEFAEQFVNCVDATKYRCAEFKAVYDGLSNQDYVDRLFENTGVNASASERTALVNGLNANPATETRASVLQKVVDGVVVIAEGNQQFTTRYGQAFYNSESNAAFVQFEYFGYMKRDPDDGGYAFWLGKLNSFGGDFVKSEMVLAFISSPEYRARFGQP